MKTIGLILAGGIGKRVGGETPKQFLLLGDRPLFFYSLEAFHHCPSIDSIHLVLPEDKVDSFSSQFRNLPSLSKLKQVVVGGQTRQGSTLAGFRSIAEPVDVVVVHDAARPLVRQATLENCIVAAEKYGAALAACPASDTMKQASEGQFVEETLDRRKIYHAQTPQAFRYLLLKEALEWAETHGFQGTDEASLVERLGRQVKIIETEATNLKITTPSDFLMAEALLKSKK